MRGRPVPKLVLSVVERLELEGSGARRKTAQAIAQRARIVLACAPGLPNKDVAAALDLDPVTVGKWRARLVRDRLDILVSIARCRLRLQDTFIP